MLESVNSKRASFPSGHQKLFLEDAKKILQTPWREIAQLLDISERTLTDWKREKFTMSAHAVELLCKKTHQTAQNITIKDAFWHTKTAGHKGGIALYKKYGLVGGDPERRKRQWRIWWKNVGQFQSNSIIHAGLPVAHPKKSAELAEFVGIVLGDGGLTPYQLVITLHHINDKAYSQFVVHLIEKLFRVTPRVYHDPKDSVVDVTVSRKELVKFCTETLGLKTGNKVRQQVDIPDWIKRNNKFLLACVRGLVDTDGSVFTHTYTVNAKSYSYKKLTFTSRSRPLLNSVYNALMQTGFHPRISSGVDVRLDSIGDMKKYFQLISSHNPKHLNRYEK